MKRRRFADDQPKALTDVFHIDTGDAFKPITGEEAVLEDVKHIIATHAPADKFKYMLLDRLRTATLATT